MKNILFIILTISFLISCSKKDYVPQLPPDKLPDATTIGANTAGCYVNGKLIILVNTIDSTSGYPVFGLKYYVGPNFGPPLFNEYFAVRIANLKNSGITYTIYLQLNNLANGIGNYALGQSNDMFFIDGPDNPQIIVSEVNTTISTGKRFISSVNSGVINITRFDYVNKIISGTFNCNLTSNQNENEIIKVTDGRFDINLVTLNI